jgi:hypothetical protein
MRSVLNQEEANVHLGTEAHKQLFCRSFIDTHRPYEPDRLPWPELNADQLQVLRGIPFWGEALKVETNAGIMVAAFAETVSDPLLREAIALQGREEARHALLLEVMMARYGIEVQRPEVALPERLEAAFINLGHEECLDSFFAFGFFEIARRAQIFPAELFALFEAILDEEARHIVFFVNWLTYSQMQRGQGAAWRRSISSLYHYGRAIHRLVSSLQTGNQSGPGFTANGAATLGLELTPTIFVNTCLEENQHRVSIMAGELLRPMLMPALFGGIQQGLQLLSPARLRQRVSA